MLSQSDLQSYLKRVGLATTGPVQAPGLQPQGPTLNLLRQIQKHQLLSIPYENLSLHWRPVHTTDTTIPGPSFVSPPFDLSNESLVQKLILHCRGGYCLELNCLLGAALQALGFSVVRVTARIVCGFEVLSERLASERAGALTEDQIRETETFSSDESGWETHQMLLVSLLPTNGSDREEYLVDVGLAKYSILEPIALSSSFSLVGTEYQGVMGKRFRISPAGGSGDRWNLSVRFPGSRIWFPYYTFAAKAADPAQIANIHYYMSMSPSSTSPPEPFATMPRNDGAGQVTLQGLTLTMEEREQGSEKERLVEVMQLEDEEEQRECFKKYFGIEGYEKDAVLVKED